MQFSATFALAMLQAATAMAMPQAVSPRDAVKLNQYSNNEDCSVDKRILFHAAPVAQDCVDLDDSTGTIFTNHGGLTGVQFFTNKGCTHKVDGQEGTCMDLGSGDTRINSVKFT